MDNNIKPNSGGTPVRPNKPNTQPVKPGGSGAIVKPNGAKPPVKPNGGQSNNKPLPKKPANQQVVKPQVKPNTTQSGSMSQQSRTSSKTIAPEQIVKPGMNKKKNSAFTFTESLPSRKKKKDKNVKLAKQNNIQQEGIQYDENGNPIEAKKQLNKLFIIIPSAIVLLIILIVIIIKAIANNSQHITLAEGKPEVVEQESVDTTENTDVQEEVSVKTPEDIEEQTTSTVEATDVNKVVAVGNEMIVPVIVNTQLEGDSEYKDYESYISIKYNGMIAGYDDVIKSVNEHNATSKHTVNIADRDTFYGSSAGNDLVMYSYTFSIPSDFPTQDKKNFKVFISPTFSMRLEGSQEPDALITNKYVFSVPGLTAMCDDIGLLKAGESYQLNWITMMPVGLDKTGYNVYFKVKLNDEITEYNVESVSIPNNDEVAQGAIDSVSHTRDENTEETDSTVEETDNTAEETDSTAEETSDTEEDKEETLE